MTKPIEKTEFIKSLAKTHNRTQAFYAQALQDIVHGLQEQLRHGKTVRIRGFGTFYTLDVSQQRARNPRTGEPITIPVHRRVAFRVGAVLKRAVAGRRKGRHIEST